jgi:hypothetical protein
MPHPGSSEAALRFISRRNLGQIWARCPDLHPEMTVGLLFSTPWGVL